MMTSTTSDEIIAVMLDSEHVRIIPPQEKDHDDVKALKLFLLACLMRRQIDGDFNEEMAEWFSSIDEETYKESRTPTTVRKQ